MKSRQKGKKKGGSKERVFGCDLLEHLQHSGQDVPQVLRSCSEFVEEHGVVDGIYRLSGVSSNIQRLRQEFEAERKPDLGKEVYLQDIHCVSSLCKAYFRELPDPLLTYRLYDKFAEAVAVQMEAERLVKIGEVLRELPDPHYRTLEFLMRHLVHMASFSAQTNMHARNLAIVWAPNLLRSKDIEASGFNGTAAFMEVRVQSIVVEFVLTHVQQLFGGAPLPGGEAEGGRRSLLLGVPRAPVGPGVFEEVSGRSPSSHLPSILQAGDGPPQMRPYHTIIEIGDHKRKGSLKVRKWRSIFNLGRSGHDTKRKTHRGGEKLGKGSLRPAKSMDSLSAVCAVCDESEELPGSDSPRPGPLDGDSQEDVSAAAAEGFPEAGTETSSAPGTPRAGRPGVGVRGPCSRAERCAGVHISDPYNVNLPSHITSMLSGPPTIVSNVSLARLTRGLECPALLPRPANAANAENAENAANADAENAENADNDSNAENASNVDEKAEASPVPVPAEAAGTEVARLSQEVQDSFSFLEDLNGSEQDWGGGEGQGAGGRLPRPLSLADDDPLYVGDPFYSGAGLQVEEFSVEPPLDELSLEEAPFVLAPACCSLDGRAPTPEESGDDVFLSAYDDLSPLLGSGTPDGEARWAPEEAWRGGGGGAGEGQEAPGEANGSQEVQAEAGKEMERERIQASGRLEDPEARGEEASGAREAEGGREGGENGPLATGAQPPAAAGLEPVGPGYPRPVAPERWPPCPSPPPPSPTGSVGMRLASTLVRVQQVRSVPVVPPKPQFAKVPCALTSKIHVAPAAPCPRPGRLDGSPAEGVSAARAQRASWRNGGSLSFDAAVALARERQRTQAPAAVRRTQTCGPPPCGPVSPHGPRPLSCVGCTLPRDPPLGGSERADPRSRLSLPPPASRPLESPVPLQRSSYAFEVRAAGLGEEEEEGGDRAGL
ncbi:rho GTPase-activating protein 30 [Ornithorhynchus anatinus]|uniref:rho GTPase-activating protein 30 n=1 Tax=Ornithorhynchus anatinus TaxID=9258 RepID=UPI0019D45C0A|nr:rho GTPase-activating protein 30 [Ornithorhynchus anatinus]